MPKKRNNAWSRQKKQKQIITARLIEISLKVDEYVYNHKPLSNTEAKQFIKEVESYKTNCIRDERSLQVIEKLTRCMKAIILEHEKTDSDSMDDGDICYLDDFRPASVSPVYSMCDDDRTQFSQTIDADRNTMDANKCDEVIDLCVDDDDDNCNLNNTASEDFIRPCPVYVEVDIHRAVSNLSLQDIPIPEQETCSQSILNNFEPYDQLRNNPINTAPKIVTNSSVPNDDKIEKNKNVKKPDIKTNEIVKVPALIIQASKIFKPEFKIITVPKYDNTKSFGDKKAKLQGDSRLLQTVNYNAFNVNNTNNANEFYTATKQIMKLQERAVQEANNKFALDKSKENNPQATLLDLTINSSSVGETNSTYTNVNNYNTNFGGLSHSDQTTKENGILDKDKKNKTSRINNGTTTETKTKRAPRKKKNVEAKENKTKNPTVKKNSNKKNKLPTSEPPTKKFDYLANTNPKIPIYNDQVINDLSWMENIRFVREINVDEHLTLNLEESFWDNYHLPASWDDSEFL